MTPRTENSSSRHALKQVKKDFFISFLAILSVTIGLMDMARPRMHSRFTALDILDLCIVFIFIVDFIVSAASSGNWRLYAKNHWYEIPSLIPITGNMVKGAETASLLRGLRLVRVVRLLRLLRVIGAATRLKQFWKNALDIAERAHLAWLAFFALVFILIGAGLGWLFEAPVNAGFQNGNSLWWALNMFSNVAYVDFQPVTMAGRFIAGILEFSGIGFIGLFTACLANALLTKEKNQEEEKPLD
jgi:voltage-gated potassium channel